MWLPVLLEQQGRLGALGGILSVEEGDVPKVWMVRAGGGSLTDEFVEGRFVSIGWDMGDLTAAKTLPDVRQAHDEMHPGKLKSAAANVSAQIHAFMNEMQAGDVILTPSLDSGVLRFGELTEDDPYFEEPNDAHRHANRRKIRWSSKHIRRARLPESIRATLKNIRTVFRVSQDKREFLSLPAVQDASDSPYGGTSAQTEMLQRIREQNPGFFELLIAELLKTMGCIDLRVSGGPGDMGIDVSAAIQVPFADPVEIYVQAKRYQPASLVNMGVVNKLKDGIDKSTNQKGHARGLIITTSDFASRVRERTANEASFIHLVNGPELAEQLIDHWKDLPQYFRDQIGPLPG